MLSTSTIPICLYKKPVIDKSALPLPDSKISQIPIRVYQQIYQRLLNGGSDPNLNITDLGTFDSVDALSSVLSSNTVLEDKAPLFKAVISGTPVLVIQQIAIEGTDTMSYQYMFYQAEIAVRTVINSIAGDWSVINSIPVDISELEKSIDELKTDLNEKVSKVSLVQDSSNSLHYDLIVDGINCGNINIPKDQFLKTSSYDSSKGTLIFEWSTIDGEKTEEVPIKDLVKPLEKDLTIEIKRAKAAEKTLSDNLASEIKNRIDGYSELNSSISKEISRATSVEAKLRTDLDYVGSRTLEAEENINKELANKVNWDESKSKIVLPSGGQIVGTIVSDSSTIDGAVIAQLNRWNVMDFGSSKCKLNLNVPKGERPTVQEAGQSGDQANKIAYLDDLKEYNGSHSIDITNDNISLRIDPSTESYLSVSPNGLKLEGVQESILNIGNHSAENRKSIEILDASLKEENKRALQAEKELKATVESKVTLETAGKRKAIVLNNNDALMSKDSSNVTAYPIVYLNTNDIVTVGTAAKEFNINIKDGARPTVTPFEKPAERIAYLSDFSGFLKAERISDTGSPSKAGDYVRLTNAIDSSVLIDIPSQREGFIINSQMIYDSLDWLSDLGIETIVLNGMIGEETPVSTLTEDKGPYLVVNMKDYVNSKIGNPAYTEIIMYAFELKPTLDKYYVTKKEYSDLETRVKALESK